MRGYRARLLLLALVLLSVPLLMAQVPRGGAVPSKHTCTLLVGADNGAVLVDADLGPQGRQCFINAAGTLLEVTVAGDAGTPNVIPRRNRNGTTANILSSALATAAAGAVACSKTSAATCLDGVTTSSATLQNTALSAGDWLELVSGTAGGSAHRVSVAITWSIP